MRPAQQELNRILNMPRCSGPSEEEAEEIQRRWVLPEAYEDGVRLLLGQVYGIWTWEKYGRVMAGLGVGQGKTLLTLMIATCWHRREEGNSLLLIPSAVHRQLWTQDIPWARAHFDIDLPIVSMGGRDKNLRRALAQAPGGRAFLLPYSLLSTTDTTELLRWIDADLVIADEAHLLRGRSAKTKRYWDWHSRWRPNVRGLPVPQLVALSGTLTSRSVLDYHRIMRFSLRQSSPLPLLVPEVEKWAEGLDADRAQPTKRSKLALSPVARWAGVTSNARWRKKHFREAYAIRLASTPGFVPAQRDTVGASLRIENRPVEGGPSEELIELMRLVEEDWTDPDGDVIMYALERFERLRQLSAGVYLRRYWPDRPGCREARDAWEAKQEWLRALRSWLGTKRIPPEGLDTPGLVNAALTTADPRSRQLDVSVVETWQEWQVRERQVPEGAPDRQVEVRRLDSYKVDAVVSWALGKPGSIIWHSHSSVGDWLEEELRARSTAEEPLRVLRKRAGDVWLYEDGSERYHCVASIGAFGQSLNLQHHQHQIVVQYGPAQEMNQLLGRVHRVGFRGDTCVVRTLATTGWDMKVVEDSIADSIYQETMGPKKLLLADWDPPFVPVYDNEETETI